MVQTRGAARRSSTVATAGIQQHEPAAAALEFDGIKNLRDLADAYSEMKSGCVFRTAAPIHASELDTKKLYNDLGIKDLIDLRSSEEMMLEGMGSPAFQGLSFCKYKRDPAVNRVVPDATSYVHGGSHSDVMRVQIPVMEKHRYYWSIVSRMKKRHALQLVATALVDKPASRRIAIEQVNEGGLEGLYRVLLSDSAEWFVAALRHIKTSAASGRPVLFFCKAGKDRTGLLAALLLSLLGASEEAILQDYVISDQFHMVALAGLEENPKVTGLDREKFERAPREAMHAALQFIQETSGSIPQYLAAAGFGKAEQEELRQLLLRDGGSSSSVAAG
uniref:Tyrosine specific protein phosphatases domain-containing protein n=1 Tax=Tetradesmus obliquus TaxID=3088 RepID=A0A383V676_TETOB|eukprot:jgi/Sobl393_1/15330/SZX60430.1